MALKASRKAIKLQPAPRESRRCFTLANPPDVLIDHGPRDKAPGDADCGIARCRADRLDRHFMDDRPECGAACRRAADSRRNRSGSQGGRRRPRVGVSRQFHHIATGRAERHRLARQRHRGRTAHGRRTDRQSAPLAAADRALRDCRCDVAAAAHQREAHRRRPQQLVGHHRDAGAHHQARRRQPGVVLRNPHQGRRAHLSERCARYR